MQIGNAAVACAVSYLVPIRINAWSKWCSGQLFDYIVNIQPLSSLMAVEPCELGYRPQEGCKHPLHKAQICGVKLSVEKSDQLEMITCLEYSIVPIFRVGLPENEHGSTKLRIGGREALPLFVLVRGIARSEPIEQKSVDPPIKEAFGAANRIGAKGKEMPRGAAGEIRKEEFQTGPISLINCARQRIM